MAIRLSTNRLDLGSANLTNAEMRGWSETVNALGNVTGATTVDLSLGNVVTATTTGSTTWSVTNVSSSNVSSFTLILTNGGSATQTWMSGVLWPSGSTPTLNSSGTDVLTFFTTDGGTVWRGAKGGPTPQDQTGQKLFVWGSGVSGQQGLGDTIRRSSPTQLVGQWTSAISVGDDFNMAVKADGSLWGWGGNSWGELFLLDKIDRSSPVQVSGTWIMTAHSYNNTFGIKADGSLWSAGYGGRGLNGLGDSVSRSSPAQISGTWRSVVASASIALAHKSDGSLWVWGQNYFGQLGLGSASGEVRSSPTQLAGNWRTVIAKAPSGGGFSVLGIRTDGTLWAWGRSSSGQLGQSDSSPDRSSPVQIGGGTWAMAMKGGQTSMAIKNDGTLWTWGNNSYGHLGLGDTILRSSPVQVGSKLWKTLSQTYNGCFGMQGDGSLFAWGYQGSSNGQLGFGDNIKRSSPTQIPGTWSAHFSGGGHVLGLKF